MYDIKEVDFDIINNARQHFCRGEYNEVTDENDRVKDEIIEQVKNVMSNAWSHLHFIFCNPVINSAVGDKFNFEQYVEVVNQDLDELVVGLNARVDREGDYHAQHYRLLDDISNKGYSLHYGTTRFTRNFFCSQGTTDTLEDDFVRSVHSLKHYQEIISEMINRIAICRVFLERDVVDLNKIKASRAKNSYLHYVRNLIDAYGWCNTYNHTFDENTPTGLTVTEPRTTNNRLEINLTTDSLLRIKDSGISLDPQDLLANGRRTLIMDIEPVSNEELKQAAHKMKFNGDLSNIKCFKINKGYKIKNTRLFADYWAMRSFATERIFANMEDISGSYIINAETPTTSFQAVTTSIGRSLSSVNRKITNNVMDKLELAF